MLRMFILVTILTTGLAWANEPPPVPEGGLIPITEGECTDNETGLAGYCYLMQDMEGNVYLTFWQNGVLMLIRKVVGDGYETVWVNAEYGSI